MSRYVRSWTKAFEFDGDNVVATLKPLSRLDAQRVATLDRTDPELRSKATALYAELVPVYVEKLDGLIDAAGAPIDLQTAATEAYFTSLVVRIGLELVQKAFPANPNTPGLQPATALPGSEVSPETITATAA